MSDPIPLPARTAVAQLAERSVLAATNSAMRAAGVDGGARIDPTAVAISYTSDRWLRIDGRAPVSFAPLSAFFAVRDGWVRTHANYPHHRRALTVALGLPDDADVAEVSAALARHTGASASAAVTARGGLCVPVLTEDPAADAVLRRRPLVEVGRVADAPVRARPTPEPGAPLRGVRVLDLTRVIAGPVATRTLALWGADVLRIDPPGLPELPAQHLDTGHGKRSALLDLSDATGAARFSALMARADIVVLGYRPAALARLGLSPAELVGRHPGLIVVQLDAWGDPQRRGFDSLVQAASGIAILEAAGDRPGALPAQALDHSAGYLLASAAIDLLLRRASEGGSWLARTSLRRIAAELLGLPRPASSSADIRDGAPDERFQEFVVDGHAVRTARPALHYPGGPASFAPPRPWGRDDPAWW